MLKNYIKNIYFPYKLSTYEQYLLNQSESTPHISDALLPSLSPERTALCTLFSKLEDSRIIERLSVLPLTFKRKAHFAFLSGRINLAIEFMKEISPVERIELLVELGPMVGISLAESGHYAAFNAFLDLVVTENKKVKDFFNSAHYKRFFFGACKSGSLPLVKQFIPLFSDNEVKTIISANYSAACNSGSLTLVDYFNTLLGDETLKVIQDSNYRAYSSACKSGNLNLVRRLNTILDDNNIAIIEAIEPPDYFPYVCAWESGNIELIKALNCILGERVVEAIQATSYHAYRVALESGDLALVGECHACLADKVIESLQAENYLPYKYACKSGSVALIRMLNNILGDSVIEALNSNDGDSVYASACQTGNFELVAIFNELLAESLIDAIQAGNYDAYQRACYSGNFELVRCLNTVLGDKKTKAIQANNYCAYHFACLTGNLELVTALHVILGDKVIEAIQANDYQAYTGACKSGNFALKKELDALLADKNISAFDDSSNACYRNYSSGKLELIKHLPSSSRDKEIHVLKTRYTSIIMLAASRDNFEVINYIFEHFPEYLAAAESNHVDFWEKFVYNFVNSKLLQLHQIAADYNQTHVDGPFDIKDKNQQQLYLYVLRSLLVKMYIKAKSSNTTFEHYPKLLSDIKYLLKIPSIRTLCAKPMGDNGKDNALLRLTLRLDIQPATNALLQIPAVHQLAKKNNFYQDEFPNAKPPTVKHAKTPKTHCSAAYCSFYQLPPGTSDDELVEAIIAVSGRGCS